MQQSIPPYPNQGPHRPPRRRLTRAEMRRRRRRRAVRRLAVLLGVLALAAGGTAFAVTRLTAEVPSAPAASPAPAEGEPMSAGSASSAASTPVEPRNALGLTAAEAAAILADPRMVLVNHQVPMPEDYTFDTKECGSATAINKTLQTEAADAFGAQLRPGRRPELPRVHRPRDRL